MACNLHIKVGKKQIANFLLLLSGAGILTWQIWNTFQVFLDGQTTLSTSQQHFDALEPPGIILCPTKRWTGINNQFSKDWYSKAFDLLNNTLMLGRSYTNDESDQQ